ncbi:uncharacterized protein BP5553_03340 [Venustampulla echinocandica]|uniref:Dicer-like protein 2 n=1 Tax=Venustampulla echinocandica TaxID=2656787 RepID=A0A370TU16_9HELO|nr:uncharacterized protein BP5553_03340 [Venustampulla echinocandica]RDL39000.1 hypothetical protein BP5553_03340 [Venustampulla echinocandica]
MDMDIDDAESSTSSHSESRLPHDVPYPTTANEIIEDFTEKASARVSSSIDLEELKDDRTPDIKPRPYQFEMFEESLKRNIIVALIWFLAPTVPLGEQQFEYIKKHISSVQVKFLSGADGVDRWTEQSLWDAVLENVKIVVSTYQILLDALTHTFIRMESLSLIIFDEAHNCVGKHPGSKIMRSFYHPRKSQGLSIPHILGLTASPVMRSNPTSLINIEETLNAICRTPKKHRAELRLQVKLPVLSEIYFESLPSEQELTGYTRTIQSLGMAFKALSITDDPYVRGLRRDGTERSLRKLEKVLLNHKTWCFSQMKTFYGMALTICRELGPWAADYYVSEVITRFLKATQEANGDLGSVFEVTEGERQYLGKALQRVKIISTDYTSLEATLIISDKGQQLIDILTQEPRSFRGIVFVQERAVVSVLAHLISIHPETRDRFNLGTMVGTSSHYNRPNNIAEFVRVGSQVNTLPDFQSGKINLVIATSVLEEGIDVPTCNVVICFQKPANLKSFVQRRGRARQRDSKLILLLESINNRKSEWQQLELAMKKLYEDDMRRLKEIMAIESTEEHDGRSFLVASTGALLDFDNAVSHLYHFCATLPAKDYVDNRPEFICTSKDEDVGSLIRARAILPVSVHKAVREAHSKTLWTSEKNAIKDAAFEAYLGLYKAGLVNEHLLPLLRHDVDVTELTSTRVEKQASIMSVDELYNPWIDVAKAWNEHGQCGSVSLRQSTVGIGGLEIEAYLPVEIPFVKPFKLYWDRETEVTVTSIAKGAARTGQSVSKTTEETWSILHSAFGWRFPVRKTGFLMLFSMQSEKPPQDLMGNQTAVGKSHFSSDPSSTGFIRQIMEPNIRYIYKSFLANKPRFEDVQRPYYEYDAAADAPHLSVVGFPKRLDFLHKELNSENTSSRKPHSVVLPAMSCIVDDMPFRYVQFGLFIPAIMHRFKVSLIAERLSTSILRAVNISELSWVITAITASSAFEDSNYQRLEFLGDSILKLCASVQLVAEYPLWHEGYLSAKKDRLVANSRLSRAAVELGLDSFIITKAFTGLKWRPPYVEDLLKAPMTGKRQLSSKVLADVVEALIGASRVDGGISKALKCIQVFLPELNWQALESRQASLYQRAPEIPLPETLKPVEEIIGYTFKKKSLLVEAMTHASCVNIGSQSLERFEFLGDSLLDNIIVEAMYAHTPPLSHFQMHILRTALVNADFLAFFCMEWSMSQDTNELLTTKSDIENLEKSQIPYITKSTQKPLHAFLRHTSPPLAQAQTNTAKRHAHLRHAIAAAIETGTRYPWALLARLEAHKFYSDLVESLLGAAWIDSGSLDTCRAMMEKMGILKYLRRILNSATSKEGNPIRKELGVGFGIHVWHPKEELGILAGSNVVKYRISTSEKPKDPPCPGDGDLDGRFICEVFVGERKVVECHGGVNKNEVQTKAAEMAVEILTRENEASMDVDEENVRTLCAGSAVS